MLARKQPLAFQWPSKRRIPWILVALAMMFTSAYSIARLFCCDCLSQCADGSPGVRARNSKN
jgi:hypothetical protein